MREQLESAESVAVGDVQVRSFAGGFSVFDSDGEMIPSHAAFWFAWSQFHPDTDLWTG
ncbi:DUF3179 domain-containing (seleno)protein [Ornithinimicrobium sp. INDO-MA30-4]|uniref:DUF3179 domain-containing (seleno)protein n=1 Tax=Ornithinimicrobium sp. INDO-MA30-4 TaxID=2908651 RepID=UPI001F268DEE|nr:DUF3179 domain-containing (seleno)protein [Ornithinimicrobium sp. INDO-MA30-4]UJH70258.1 DUF3179 domain-containing protein [Ornithinimicrobium sp. INDO-MA30-4]